MTSGIRKRKLKPIIKIGDKFGKLIAIRFDCIKSREQFWLFRCECGNEKVIRVNNVKRGTTKSCGCLYSTHGMKGTRTYISFVSMKDRCLNPNSTGYKYWGGRGIKICDRWLGKNGFQNFLADMGERPIGKSLDRKNNDKDYCKSNCRYATSKQQNNNRRDNLINLKRNL